MSAIQALADADVKIWSYLEDREISLDDEMAEAEQFLKAWAGSSERRKASQRVRDKMRQLAEQGRYTGGRLLGYTVQDGQRVVKPSEAALVRRIFKRRADGAGFFKISKELQRDGIASPRGGKFWSPTQVGLILRNETYAGVLVYSRTRQSKRRGTSATLKSPESIIRTDAPKLRIVSPELWDRVQAVNQAAAAATWRASDGRLKSRPTEAKHLLTPFLACGECGGSFYVRRDAGKEYLHCVNRHHFGRTKCTNGHRLSVALAERAIMQTFEEALVGNIVMSKLQEILEAHRQAQLDPAPLQAEAKRLRAEITRLVDLAARGEEVEVLDGIRTRKVRLSQVEEQLAGTAAVAIDVEAFRDDVMAAVADWRGHLKKNKNVAAQVLRKILPERLKVTPSPRPGVAWEFTGMSDYRKILEECGLAPVMAAVEQLAKVSRTGRPS